MQFDPSIFKAYDIRGVYPNQINGELAYKVGQAYVQVTQPQGEVLVGCDVRIRSQALKDKLIEGINDAGVDVIDVGLISTDMLYFGVGYYKTHGGIQVTASHNPPEWHGFKMVRQGPTAMTLESGIGQIRDLVASGQPVKEPQKGKLRKMDIWDDYCKYILGWIDTTKIKPMKVVLNANFGLAAKIFQKIVQLGNLPIEIVPLNAEPDGTFPKGRPDPFVPENREEFVKAVIESNADLGIAWDADADRVFFAADGGLFLEPYYLNTLLIKSMLQRNPNEKIIYDVRYTWALIDAIKENRGTPILSRVGHSYIKEKMKEENALFATESSGHTYYRDYWYADCGMIPPVQLIELLSIQGRKLSELMQPVMNKYFMSGEINTTVSDVSKVLAQIKEKFADGQISELDGISVEYPNYRFNVRSSNTEPLLRLNLEAKSKETMEEKRDKVLEVIRG